MQNNSPENGVRTIWLNQPTEKPTMISKLIEQRSRTLRAKTRRGLIGTVAGPLVAGFFYAYSMKAFPALRQVLQPSFAFALAWVAAQGALVLTASRRADAAFGFRMFAES